MKNRPINKNEIIEVEISDLSHKGLGVGHVEGFPVLLKMLYQTK